MRYLITGGSGYIGTRLIGRLLANQQTERIAIADLKPPAGGRDRVEFKQCDVSTAAIDELLLAERPDVLIHLAFILNPIHDRAKMYEVDVNGCQRVLAAADKAGIGHVLVTSSATAYGAWPDNPVPMSEEWPIRGVPQFEYARDKAESDRICQLWAANHPDKTVTIVRPAIVFGPNVDNFIIRSWRNFPFFPHLDGVDTPTQFVHEDDLIEALLLLLKKKQGGIYNITGDGLMSWRDCASLVGLKARKVSTKAMYRLVAGLWKLHAPRTETPPGMIYFLRYPWVVSSDKLKADTGWQPQYDSRTTFEIAIQAKGFVKG